MVLSNTTVATVMASIDVNIVVIALPTIGRELKAPVLDLLWVLLVYNLIVSSVVVNFGRLSDIFGRVKLYNFGFATFTVGSALCSLAQSGGELIAFRMVQGVGAAFLFSNSTAIITDTFPSEERGKALGINRAAQVIGATVGLVLGGFLTTFAGWQSIFWVNVPIGIFGTIWSHYKLKELAVIKQGQGIDLAGNFAFGASLVLLLAGISLYALGSIGVAWFILMVSTGVALFGGFVMIERRVKYPMLDLSLFKIRAFSGGTLATLLNALARGCVLLVMTIYLQGPTMNASALVAGIFLLPISVAVSFWGPISGFLSDRGGVRFYSTLGLFVSLVGFLLLAQIGPTITFLQAAIPLALIGSGEGIFSSPNRASVMNSVPPHHRGVGGAVNTTMISVGNTFSRGLSFLLMGLVLPASYLQNVFVGNSVSTSAAQMTEFVGSLHLVFYVCAAFVAISIIPSLMREPIRRYD